jgi:hypothetical protein
VLVAAAADGTMALISAGTETVSADAGDIENNANITIANAAPLQVRICRQYTSAQYISKMTQKFHGDNLEWRGY